MNTTIKAVCALVVLAAGVVVAVDAASPAPYMARPATDATWQPAVTPVGVDAPGNGVITLAPVTITATVRRPARQVAPCAFAPRDLTQGSGQVRGFCL